MEALTGGHIPRLQQIGSSMAAVVTDIGSLRRRGYLNLSSVAAGATLARRRNNAGIRHHIRTYRIRYRVVTK
jgi:hypothetical protein